MKKVRKDDSNLQLVQEDKISGTKNMDREKKRGNIC